MHSFRHLYLYLTYVCKVLGNYDRPTYQPTDQQTDMRVIGKLRFQLDEYIKIYICLLNYVFFHQNYLNLLGQKLTGRRRDEEETEEIPLR